jgi:hypothetical protein
MGELPERGIADRLLHLERNHDRAEEQKEQGAHSPSSAGWQRKLAAHRKSQGDPTSGPIFPSGARFPNGARKATDPNNVLGRVILPALNVCGVCSKPEGEHNPETKHKYERNKVLPHWHGWHAFRRGLATNLHQMGVDDLTIEAILRHSNVSVTQRC